MYGGVQGDSVSRFNFFTFFFTAHRKLISRRMSVQTKDKIAVILFLLKSVPGVLQVEMAAMLEYQVKMLMAWIQLLNWRAFSGAHGDVLLAFYIQPKNSENFETRKNDTEIALESLQKIRKLLKFWKESHSSENSRYFGKKSIGKYGSIRNSRKFKPEVFMADANHPTSCSSRTRSSLATEETNDRSRTPPQNLNASLKTIIFPCCYIL